MVLGPEIRNKDYTDEPMKRDTKKLILDAAEELFGQHGFDGVSIRDITGKANVRLNLATYHFTNKQSLLEAVVARRSGLLNESRWLALVDLQARGSNNIEEILTAFIRPYYQFRLGTEPGWKNYTALIASLMQQRRWLPIAHHFTETARLYRDALCAALPGTPKRLVVRAFVFSIELMTTALSNDNLYETVVLEATPTPDLPQVYRDLIRFLAGGFLALTKADAGHSAGPKQAAPPATHAARKVRRASVA
jgi:AcrR family transcriptional regulator